MAQVGIDVSIINLLTLLWTDDEVLIPCDFRVYDKPMGGHTKNESFREMLVKAGERASSRVASSSTAGTQASRTSRPSAASGGGG